ncbi:hypothetical protein [Kordiimonas lacus]|uniref:Uncharacterized protein n=1 Tax=Kordiimonas lacus TaxID=637679 RepID=A0A1G6XTC6_9PROT|nr:hypothetical protein [Kordiimonas lacus]SDD81390.1 hypothetical protein SAMN04488071_1356 [Kordiimonas lacus]
MDHRLLHVFVGVALACIAGAASDVRAADKRCECNFRDQSWQGYGTAAACSVWMYKDKTVCEVEFGGFSADRQMLADLLELDWKAYENRRFEIFSYYYHQFTNRNRKGLSDPNFLQAAIPVFMRGAYLRKHEHSLSAGSLKALDGAIAAFFEEHAHRVSDVFLGMAPAFEASVSDAGFTVDPGVVTVTFEGTSITTIFIPWELEDHAS